MTRTIKPRTIAPPSSRYAHGIVHSARARRLVIAGQVGVAVDGELAAGFEAQCEQAFENIGAILAEAGMTMTNLIRVTAYSRESGGVGVFRAVRDRCLGGHLVAATYVEVAGLAKPDYLIEIEAEAVCEEPDLAFLELDPENEMASSGVPGRTSAAPAGARRTGE